EYLVLLDWPADRAAELVHVEWGNLCRIEELASVKGIVPQVLVSAAVKVVGTGLGDDRGERPDSAAVFGGNVLGVHTEFLNRVRRRLGVRAAAQTFVRYPIQLIAVHVHTSAIHHCGKTAVSRLADQVSGVDCTGSKLDHLENVTSIQRQVLHLAGRN